MKRIAVITARADAGEQKSILAGITQRCFDLGADTVVYSNIFNYWVKDEILNFENAVYDFFNPSFFDGVIVTAEAFFDKEFLSSILERIKKSSVPAVIINGRAEGFNSVSSNDEEDFERIAEHLIGVHGFLDIDILTGFKNDEAAEKRVLGCKKAFRKYGVRFSKSKVHYGNFWTDSGEEHARKYINGEIPMPQAVICTNDYMAFGLCDELTANGVKIPEQLTVTGYEYSESRTLHYPILTTYNRDRYKLGTDAVNILLGKSVGSETRERLICGNTCSCGADPNVLFNETRNARIGQYYNEMTTVAQFGSKLTLCHSLSEYVSVLKDNMYLHHGASKLYLCVSEEWSRRETTSDKYLCCDIDLLSPTEFHKTGQPPFLIETHSQPMVYCISPLVFEKNCFGFTALCYNFPQTYDFSFRDWNKNAVNALEFLRLKNDIHYLKKCRSVSALYDALTGFNNEQEFRETVGNSGDNRHLAAVRMLFTESKFTLGENYRNNIISAVAAAVKQCCRKHEIVGRINEDTFAVLFDGENELFYDRLQAFVYHSIYRKGYESSVVLSFSQIDSADLFRLLELSEKSARIAVSECIRQKELPRFKELSELHSRIMSAPKSAPSIEEACKTLCLGVGRFRVIYKELIGMSYVNDCICGRITLAKYLLSNKVMSIYSVAVQCGYSDEKFFSRQFKKLTGYSPKQYRDL